MGDVRKKVRPPKTSESSPCPLPKSDLGSWSCDGVEASDLRYEVPYWWRVFVSIMFDVGVRSVPRLRLSSPRFPTSDFCTYTTRWLRSQTKRNTKTYVTSGTVVVNRSKFCLWLFGKHKIRSWTDPVSYGFINQFVLKIHVDTPKRPALIINLNLVTWFIPSDGRGHTHRE